MAFYSAGLQGITPGTNTCVWDIYKSGSPGMSRITEVYNFGESGASTINRLRVARNLAAGTGAGTALNVQNISPTGGTNAFAANASYATTQPTYTANAQLLMVGFNGFGGLFKWTAYKDDEGLYQIAGLTGYTLGISLSSPIAGAGVISGHVIWEEF
jgi:hypothetical protein